MNNGKIVIEIPNSIVEECITAGLIQMKGSYGSIDVRCTEVERIEHHVGEIVTAIIIKMACKQIKLK